MRKTRQTKPWAAPSAHLHQLHRQTLKVSWYPVRHQDTKHKHEKSAQSLSAFRHIHLGCAPDRVIPPATAPLLAPRATTRVAKVAAFC